MKGKYYLPPESQSNSDLIHDVMVGKKRVSIYNKLYWLDIKMNDVVMTHSPHFKGLRVFKLSNSQAALRHRFVPSRVKR